jgi:hypothetical protein
MAILASPAHAQWSDDFSDGDFTNDPAWTGSTSLFHVLPDEGRMWLASAGAARADTIYLATESSIAFGTWRFRFRHRDVNLSNFNGVRVFLTADSDDLRGEIRGYFLQFGTNNSNQIRLFRIDGDQRNRRVEIGRYDAPILDGTSNEFEIQVVRDADARWSVHADGIFLFETVDDRYTTGSHFGIWVKHSAAAPDSYYFTDFHVEPGEGPPPDPPVLSASVLNAQELLAVLSPPIANACSLNHWMIDGGPAVANAKCLADGVRLTLASRLMEGAWKLALREFEDDAGNFWDEVTTELTVSRDDLTEFAITSAIYAWRAPDEILLTSSTSLTTSGLETASIDLDGLRPIEVIRSDARSARIIFPQTLKAGDRLLRIEHLADARERTLDTLMVVHIPELPAPRDIVINEIHYDPPDQAWEFVELYNRSERPFDAAWFDFSDDRLVRTPLLDGSHVIEPGGYAVFVRDPEAFEIAFPGVDYLVPPTWHVLNNAGDAVILYAGDVVMDSVSYTAAWGGRDVSLERIDPDAPSVRANFASSTDPTGATPGRVNSMFFQDPTSGRFTRARQSATNMVEIFADRGLSDVQPASASVSCHGTDVLGFHVTATIVEVSTGGPRPTRCHASGFVDALLRPMATFDDNVAVLPGPSELLISEIMFDPLNDPFDDLPDQPFFVEVASTASYPLSLDHIMLSGPVNETGGFSVVPHDRQHVVLAPGGFAVFSAEGTFDDDVVNRGLLATAFPHFAQVDGLRELLPVRRTTLGTPRSGGTVRLIRADSVELDRLTYDPAMHHPSLRITRGRSLERRDLADSAKDTANWASSHDQSGGTPGAPNSVSLDRSPDPDQAPIGIVINPRVFAPESASRENEVEIRYRLRVDASTVRARIYDSRGRLVRTLEPGLFTGPSGVLRWDGYSNDRQPLRVGRYIVLLDAVDLAGGTVERYRDSVVLGRDLRE